MNEKRSGSIRIIIVAVATILVAVAAVIIIAKTDRVEAAGEAKAEVTPQVYTGTSYIKGQEKVPVAPIEEEIRAEEEKVLRQARMKEMMANPALIFEAIKSTNTVLIGESRTSGFTYYGYLDDNHFLGGVGWSIQEIPAVYDRLAALQPANIVFSFGINEMGRYLDSPVYYYSPEIYAADLDRFITDIKGLVPNAKIYINCIVPCTDAVYQEYSGYGQIPAWNEYLKSFCEEKGYGYIDITDLCQEHQNMYIEDGMHLVGEFYPYWGARIVETILS